MRKPSILRFFYARNRLRAIPNRENASLILIQGRDQCIEAKIKHFRIFMRKPSILRFFYARNRLRALSKLENVSLTLIQGNRCQGSVFKVRECAQSISRIEKPKN